MKYIFSELGPMVLQSSRDNSFLFLIAFFGYISYVSIFIFPIVLFFCSTDLILFSVSIFFPILIGLFIQEKLIGVSNKDYLYRIKTISLGSLIAVLASVSYHHSSFNPGVGGIIEYYCIIYMAAMSIGLLLWNVFSHEKKYISKINTEIFYVYVSMFFYLIGGILAFSIGTIYVGLLLILFQRSKNQFFRWFNSIVYSLIFLVFWGNYIVYIHQKYYGVFKLEDFTMNNIIIMGEFIVFGLGLGYIMQSIIMINTYFPSRNNFYGKSHRKEIARVNKLLLDRFDIKDTSLTSIFFSISLLTILVTIHNGTNFIPIQLLIGLTFTVVSFMGIYLKSYKK